MQNHQKIKPFYFASADTGEIDIEQGLVHNVLV